MERMRVTTQTIPGNVWGLVIIASSPGLDQSLLALAQGQRSWHILSLSIHSVYVGNGSTLTWRNREHEYSRRVVESSSPSSCTYILKIDCSETLTDYTGPLVVRLLHTPKTRQCFGTFPPIPFLCSLFQMVPFAATVYRHAIYMGGRYISQVVSQTALAHTMQRQKDQIPLASVHIVRRAPLLPSTTPRLLRAPCLPRQPWKSQNRSTGPTCPCLSHSHANCPRRKVTATSEHFPSLLVMSTP